MRGRTYIQIKVGFVLILVGGGTLGFPLGATQKELIKPI